MIKVRCRTNLDGYSNAIWPTEMLVRPMVGDRVASEQGGTLSVVSVIHHQAKDKSCYLEVELNRGY